MKKARGSEIEGLLTRFLAEYRESDDGGWSPVTDGDMVILWDLINAIMEAKFARDCDGDMPLEFIIVNRNKYRPLQFVPIPYNGSNVDLLMDELINLNIASDYVGIRVNLIRRENLK